MAVHQAPTRSGERLGGHLHVEFYPPLRTAEKLKYPAGSEQGAGTFISDILPEESAEHLRAALARAALSERRAGRAGPRLRPRAGQPDRRAHRLQRRPRAAFRDRPGRHRRRPRRAASPGPRTHPGERARTSASATSSRSGNGLRPGAGGPSCAAPRPSCAARAGRSRRAELADRRRPAARRRPVLLGGARGRAVPGADRARRASRFRRAPSALRAGPAVRPRGERLGRSEDRAAGPARQPVRGARARRADRLPHARDASWCRCALGGWRLAGPGLRRASRARELRLQQRREECARACELLGIEHAQRSRRARARARCQSRCSMRARHVLGEDAPRARGRGRPAGRRARAARERCSTPPTRACGTCTRSPRPPSTPPPRSCARRAPPEHA